MVELTFDAFMKRSKRASRDQEWGYSFYVLSGQPNRQH